MTQTPAGWHPAPDRPGQLRYWDGARWTDHYAAGAPPIRPPKRRGGAGVVIAVLAVVMLFGGCLAVALASDDTSDPGSSTADDKSAKSEPDPDDPDVIGDETGAQVVCEDFVEEQLKAPSTAEFGDETVVHIKGPVWQVMGEVDAENGFGAMIRANYVCRVRFTGDDSYRLLSLTGLDA